MYCCTSGAENGGAPAVSSYRMTPSENTSERPSIGLPVTCSGDMYLGEPSTAPTWVSMSDARMRATPKSITLARLSPTIMMLPGLTSRCTTPRSCANASPSATCARISSTNGSSRPPRFIMSRSSTPSSTSIAM